MHVSIQATEKGSVSSIRVVESEQSFGDPQAGQVLLKHLTSGVAFADGLITNGTYPKSFGFPVTLGYDLIAVVIKVGPGESALKAGDRVAVMPCVSSWQTDSIQQGSDCVKVPENVDSVEAVACVLNYVTAYQMMTRLQNLQPGDAVLVHAASGGVGQALLDLFKTCLPEIKVYGTASLRKKDLVESLGATFIDYKTDDFAKIMSEKCPEGVAMAYDAVGYENMKKSLQCLSSTKPSTLVIYGVTNDAMSGDKMALLKIGLHLLGARKLAFWSTKSTNLYNVSDRRDQNPDEFKQDLSFVLDLLSKGKLHPTIYGVLPLRQARHALEELQAGKSRGKIVLVIDSDLEQQYRASGRLTETLP